jgi:predicted phosphodiesterase
MRVAALYDVHANLPALAAVMEEVRRSGAELIIVGGDVLPGPMPRETLAYLLGLEVPAQFLYGNGEVAVLEQMSGKTPLGVPEQFLPIIGWNAEQVSEYESELRAWPKTVRVSIDGLGDALFCHGTPRDENEIFTRLTAEEQLLPVFEGLNFVVCGHTHMQFDRKIGSTRVVNAGSVGMPFGDPGADWLLLGPDVELRHTTYDLESAARHVRATRYPQAEEFAAGNILAPPTEATMLELFTSTRPSLSGAASRAENPEARDARHWGRSRS